MKSCNQPNDSILSHAPTGHPERSEAQRNGVEGSRGASLKPRHPSSQSLSGIPRLRCALLGMTTFALAVFALTSVHSAHAIAGVDTPPAPSAPHEAKFAEPKETTLANGLRVIVAERHQLPLLAATVVIRHGAEADPPDRAGTASLVGDLLTKGTTTMSAPEIATAIESLGGSIDSGAGWDQSAAGLTIMSDKAGVALKILADVVLHPAFQQEEIDRLKSQRLDGLRVALQQPGSLARFVTERALFGDGEYGHSVSGTLESVQAIKREDIVQLYETKYRPQDAAFILAGDITLARAKQYAEELFGSWKNPEAASPNDTTKTGAKSWKPSTTVIDMPDAGQAAVILSKPTIRRDSPDYYPALVANAALGNGFVSRLNREVRIKRGLSYGAGSSIDARRDAGVFTASAQTKNESAAEVASLIAAEMKKLVTAPVEGEELKSRQAVLTGGYARNLETNRGFAGQMAVLAVYQLPLDTLDKFIPAINAVKADDVTAFAKTELATTANTVVVGKASAFLPALKKSAPNTRVIEQKNLDLNQADLKKPK